MIKERDYLYRILGLQPGASPVEIKSAYRNLVKLYHPDRDQSPDTGIMYKEIREAYEKLLNCDSVNEKYTKTEMKTSTVGSHNSAASTWTYKDWDKWEKENISKHFSKDRKKHESLFSNLIGSNIFLAFALALYSTVAAPIHVISLGDQNYSDLATDYHIVSWIIFIFARRYITPTVWPFFVKFIAGVLYGAILVALIVLNYSAPVSSLFWTGWVAAMSVWVLMADFPIIWRRGMEP